MAVQLITNKVIKKYDTNHPNFRPEPVVEKEVDGNVKDDNDDIYNERVYYAPSEPNGNLKIEEMMGKMMGKLDNLSGTKSQTGTEAIEVDIEKNSKLLDWQPLQSTDDGLRQMVEDFLSNE